MGGIILGNYVARAGDNCPLEGAVCVSSCADSTVNMQYFFLFFSFFFLFEFMCFFFSPSPPHQATLSPKTVLRMKLSMPPIILTNQ